MSLSIESLSENALELDVDGKLESSDYEQFTPLAEQRIEEHGEISLLVRLASFRGWSPGAFWDDLKFDVAHYNDVKRLALVGEESSVKWMAIVSKPFTSAEVRYFAREEIDEARSWIRGDDA